MKKLDYFINTDTVDIRNKQIGIHAFDCNNREFCAGVNHNGTKESVNEATRIANVMANAENLLLSLIIARALLQEFAKGNVYLERGEMDKVICKALGLDYKTIKTEDFEKSIKKYIKMVK